MHFITPTNFWGTFFLHSNPFFYLFWLFFFLLFNSTLDFTVWCSLLPSWLIFKILRIKLRCSKCPTILILLFFHWVCSYEYKVVSCLIFSKLIIKLIAYLRILYCMFSWAIKLARVVSFVDSCYGDFY